MEYVFCCVGVLAFCLMTLRENGMADDENWILCVLGAICEVWRNIESRNSEDGGTYRGQIRGCWKKMQRMMMRRANLDEKIRTA